VATLTNVTSVNPSFIADKEGTYQARLVVSNGLSSSTPSTVSITVSEPQNNAPVLAGIPNQTVSLGSAMKYTLTATDADINDTLLFSSLALPEGANLDSVSGVFTFSPSSATPANYTFTFSVKDKAGATSTKTMQVTVNSPPLSTPTSLSGRVLDTTSWAVDQQEVPIVGVTVSIMGTGISSATDQNGYFTLNNIPDGYALIDFATASAAPGPGGSAYAGFREKVGHIIEHANNIIERPFYLPRLDASSITPINNGGTTTVTNPNLDISLTIPANTAKFANGTPFTGTVSISEVPLNVAPVSMPDFVRPRTLITIQPVGLVFSNPVPITFPNTEGYAPGSEVNIMSVDPEVGVFVPVGRGRVTAEGTKIERI